MLYRLLNAKLTLELYSEGEIYAYSKRTRYEEAVGQRQAVLFAGAGCPSSSLPLLGENIRDVIDAEIQKDNANYDYRLQALEDVCDEYVALNDCIMVNRLAAPIHHNAIPTESPIAENNE